MVNGRGEFAHKTWGRYSEAEPLYRRALAIYEQKYNSDNFFTQQTRRHLQLLYDAVRKSP